MFDDATTTDETMQRTFALAAKLDGYDVAFMDQSRNPAAGEAEPDWERMNDPQLTIVNVLVTHDVEAAEARLREVWGGMLCVGQGVSTLAERLRIQREITSCPGCSGAAPATRP